MLSIQTSRKIFNHKNMQETITALSEQLKKMQIENEDLKYRLSLVSGQYFCSKAEMFVAFLERENMKSFWEKDKLLYYFNGQEGEDIPADVVLARFEEIGFL